MRFVFSLPNRFVEVVPNQGSNASPLAPKFPLIRGLKCADDNSKGSISLDDGGMKLC